VQSSALLNRKDSGETLQTETVMEPKAGGGSSSSEENTGQATGINYSRLKNQIMSIDASGESFSKGGLLRVKPWEAYRFNESLGKGLLAALSQEDIDRVNSIYFMQEMLKEEEKADSEFVTCRDMARSEAF